MSDERGQSRRALVAALPDFDRPSRRFLSIAGTPPDLGEFLAGPPVPGPGLAGRMAGSFRPLELFQHQSN
ncbi:hypothetical protein AB0M95_20710 [Sphaerisporangium sp. NPDC051017]|uniref:hypothetical protein n=1 Tax=Sphaerisporangium sp. NPDC051017 TaxID=3154636 RepID=UPI003419CEDC